MLCRRVSVQVDCQKDTQSIVVRPVCQIVQGRNCYCFSWYDDEPNVGVTVSADRHFLTTPSDSETMTSIGPIWTLLSKQLQKLLLENGQTSQYCENVQQQIGTRVIRNSSLFGLLFVMEDTQGHGRIDELRAKVEQCVKEEAMIQGPIPGPLWAYEGSVIARIIKLDGQYHLSMNGEEQVVMLRSLQMRREFGVCHMFIDRKLSFVHFKMWDILGTTVIRKASVSRERESCSERGAMYAS